MISKAHKIPKKTLLGVLFFVTFFLLGGLNTCARAFSLRGEWVFVRWVVDGDTFFIGNGKRVRLKGIDAPEVSHAPDEVSQYYARESKGFLISLIWKKRVLLGQYGREQDRFHRILAYVYLPDGRFVNLLMVKKGYAFCFPHKDESTKMRRLFLKAQRIAMKKKRGFWKKILSLSIAHQKFVGSMKTLRFHTLNCVFGKKIPPNNRVYFSSLYSAFFSGYAPCRRCTVWPLANY